VGIVHLPRVRHNVRTEKRPLRPVLIQYCSRFERICTGSCGIRSTKPTDGPTLRPNVTSVLSPSTHVLIQHIALREAAPIENSAKPLLTHPRQPKQMTRGDATMRDSEGIASEQGSIGEARLWQAVIIGTIRDWISGPLRQKDEAEEYLFGGGTDFTLVCESAGMDAHRLRAQLGRLKRSSTSLGARNGA
jgi:hypothetical protein